MALLEDILQRLFPQMAGTRPPAAMGTPPFFPRGTTPPFTAPNAGAARPVTGSNANSGQPEASGAPPATPLSGTPKTTLSEEEWSKANPLPQHTPYTPPNLKQRLLEGLFAGMQEFGRPGEGARTVQNYLGDINAKTEAEKNYPLTSAAQQHQGYENYIAGQKGPIDLQNLDAELADRRAQAAQRTADAAAKGQPKYQHYVIDDPANPGNPKAVLFDQKTGAYIDPDTQNAIPGAKPFEKPQAEKNLEKITVMGPDNKPHVYGVNAKGEKVQDFGVAPNETPGEKHSATELAQVERETRTNIRKAQENYRTAQNHATLLGDFVDQANKGNKVTAQALPLEGALAITTSQGTKRINRTEVEQIAGAGSLWDRIMGKVGSLKAGQPYPDDIKQDMKSLASLLEDSAYKQYGDTYDDEMGIAKGYGLDLGTKLPRLKRGGEAAATTANGPTRFDEWQKKQK